MLGWNSAFLQMRCPAIMQLGKEGLYSVNRLTRTSGLFDGFFSQFGNAVELVVMRARIVACFSRHFTFEPGVWR